MGSGALDSLMIRLTLKTDVKGGKKEKRKTSIKSLGLDGESSPLSPAASHCSSVRPRLTHARTLAFNHMESSAKQVASGNNVQTQSHSL